MRRPRSVAFSIGLAILLSAAGTALADEGRVNINALPGPPYVLSAPGHYILEKDIVITGGSAIVVDADCVEVNLNGKTITSTSGSGNLIQINDGVSDVTILNGCLTGGRRGIDYTTATGFGTAAQIRDVKIRNATERGISILGARDIEISSCRVERIAGDFGIYVDSLSTPFTGRLTSNTVIDVGGWGIYAQGLEGGEVTHNVVRQFGSAMPGTAGIWLDGQSAFFVGGNEIAANKVSFGGGDDDGLVVGDASRNNLIRDNTLYENGRTGLWLPSSDGNTVQNNVIGRNGGNGIKVQASFGLRNLFQGNHIESNGGFGIEFGAGTANNVCRDNVVHNNAAGPSAGPPQTSLGGNFPAALCL